MLELQSQQHYQSSQQGRVEDHRKQLKGSLQKSWFQSGKEQQFNIPIYPLREIPAASADSLPCLHRLQECIDELGSHYTNRTFYVFCDRNYTGTQDEDLSTVKSGGPVCVALWFLLHAFHVESCLALCFRVVLFNQFSIVITSLGEKRAGLYASRACVVYFECIDLCPSSLPVGVRG